MIRVLRPGLLLILSIVAAVSSSGQSSASPQNFVFSAETSRTAQPEAASAEANAPKSAVNAVIVGKPQAAVTNLLAEASLLYRRGKLTTAAEKYRLMLLADPSFAPAFAGLARIYLKQGDVMKASETVNRGLKLSNSDDLHVALGEVYFREGRISAAETEWLKVVNSGTPNARAYFGLSRVRHALSFHKTGREMLDKARNLNPADPDIEMDWTKTLPLVQRVALLESYLSSQGVSAKNDHAESQRYLDYLKLLTRAPDGNCRLVNRPSAAEFSLERLLIDSDHVRGYGLRVALNGRKTTLMLDTGANGIILSQKAAERAGVGRGVQTEIAGIGDAGRKTGYFGVAKSVRIGDLEFENCVVRVLDKRTVVEDEGLIGAVMFESFFVNLDFPQEKLRISELPRSPEKVPENVHDDGMALQDACIAPEMQSYTRFYRFGHYVLVPTRVGNSEPKLFVLDTGAYQSQITPGAAREVTKVWKDTDTRVVGISGPVKNIFSADRALFEFGRVRQENQDLLAFDLRTSSDAIGTEISGILGFTTLRALNIKIDYRDGLVDFDLPHR